MKSLMHPLVFRMRWINTRAAVDRVIEELGIQEAEMGMLVRSYRNKADFWAKKAELMEGLGDSVCYEPYITMARTRERVWRGHEHRAYDTFNTLFPTVKL